MVDCEDCRDDSIESVEARNARVLILANRIKARQWSIGETHLPGGHLLGRSCSYSMDRSIATFSNRGE
jgi:hypothetical protein